MTDPVIANPLPKPTVDADIMADVSKLENIWSRYEVYIVAAVCLIVGAIAGHKLL